MQNVAVQHLCGLVDGRRVQEIVRNDIHETSYTEERTYKIKENKNILRTSVAEQSKLLLNLVQIHWKAKLTLNIKFWKTT